MMSYGKSPSLARRTLAKKLQKAREAKGLSPQDLGALTGYHKSTINKIERAEQGVKQTQLEGIVKHLDITDEERSYLFSLRLRSNQRGWWESHFDLGSASRISPTTQLLVEAEQAATRIRSLQAEVIPGLIQTQEYHHEMDRAAVPSLRDDSGAGFQIRSRRSQLLFSRDDQPQLEFIVGAGAMHYLSQMPEEVRRGQLQRLEEVASLPNASIHVLDRIHAAAAGGFTLIDSPDLSLVYQDVAHEGSYREEKALLSLYDEIFTHALKQAVGIREYLNEMA
ncbi:helix-turn-helix domain-containing protein [Natronoglycomyces albus]|uniref:Helix-turn-helix transcriptional regulator n=1 Tax=Natronoglycomyces albus TaxID=2811108 RepID=A0A895XQV9_9ACTN|nr:helix-turn-helix transcriptional regulator [Natronoglycomyces albus]QSB05759.1 helix-turn-helix transcriptional regulator [Natronoglycomyces albus]